MTKKFLSIIFFIATALILGSCDSSDDLRVEQMMLDKTLFAHIYTADEDGCYVLKDAKPISSADVQSKVVDYGWMAIAAYELQADGKLSTDDYYEDLIGGGPTHYWFESSQQLVKYWYVDAMPTLGFTRVAWSYDADKGFILRGDCRFAMADRYEQILKLDEADGYTLMYTMRKLAIRGDGKGNYKPVYAMVVYKRMTDAELKDMQKRYAYDLN